MRSTGPITKLAIVASAAALGAPAALAWPGRPPVRPPSPPADGAPPPAWVETQTRSNWLAYGSYCWTPSDGHAACVDMIPPQSRPELPTVRVARGSTVRIHLAFAERSLTLTIDRRRMLVAVDRGRRIVSWRARSAGILIIDVHGVGGSASYVARLRVS